MLAPDLLAQSDPEVWDAIRREQQRQEDHVELIASENYVSRQVLIAQGSALTNTIQTSRLRGLSNGTPLEVASTYETRGRLRMRSTVVATKAPAGLPSCTINITRQPPAAKVHLVPTGDPSFDSAHWVTSDTPAAVRAWLSARACSP